MLTDEAAAAIRQKMAMKDGVKGLLLTVKSTGCSGYSYHLDFTGEENLALNDKFEKDGAVLYIPKTHSWMLFGMEVGFEQTKMSSGFTFTNPNETGRCGCGESFSVERPKP
jgi:iron-sulfur cluster assembly protein